MAKRTTGVAALTVVLLLASWFAWLRPAFLGGDVSYLAVTGSSMEPRLRGGDLAILRHRPVYDTGSVVAFRADGGLVIHRIVGGDAESGYVVKGDNKERADPWSPKPQDIVGEMWVRVPLLGLPVSALRHPPVLGITVGVLSMLSLLGAGGSRARRRARDGRSGAIPFRMPVPGRRSVALGTLTLFALGSGLLAAYAYTQPLRREHFVEQSRIEHSSSFDYDIELHPSSLYDSTRLSPDELDRFSDGAAARLYANLVREIDLRFDYRLSSPWVEPSGTYSADLVIAADQGWTKTVELVPPTAFTGDHIEFGIPVRLASVLGLIERIEEETAFKASAYDLSFVPRMSVRGETADASSETYEASFPIRLNGREIALPGNLDTSESRTLGGPVSAAATIRLLGGEVPVGTLRLLALLGLTAALVPAAILTVALLRGRAEGHGVWGLGAGERAQVIQTTDADLPASAVKVRVASRQDLMRFAERENCPVFRSQPAAGSERLFAIGEHVTCEFWSD